MRIRTACILAALAAGLYPVASMSSPRCPMDFSVQHRLEAEREKAQNLVARERAAIEDLKHVTGTAIHERHDRNEISSDEFNRLFDQREAAMVCLDADNALKDQQAYYAEQTKLIEAGCSTGPVDKMYVGWMREAETQKAKACGKADLEYLAQAVRRLKEIQADKLAKEEKSTPAIKTSDVSQKRSRFCEQIRSASAHAATLFAAITKEKKDPWFIEPGTLGSGSKGIKLSAIVEIDEYVTPLVLDSPDFLSAPARCAIKIGTLKDIIFRVVPTYACEWNYDKTTRRQPVGWVEHLRNPSYHQDC
jgi:hypothetical protein